MKNLKVQGPQFDRLTVTNFKLQIPKKFGFQFLFCFVGFFLFFCSCSSVKTIAPVAKTEQPVIELKPSYISLPVELDVKDLEKKINMELKGLLYEDNSFEGDDMKVKAWKKQDFKISVTGNNLFYSLPLKVSIIYRKFIEFPEVTADIIVKFKTQFSINNDWTLTTKTTPLGFDWMNAPSVNIAGFEISLKPVADLILAANREAIGNEVDESVKMYLQLKPYAMEAWALLHKPIAINDTPKVWLKMAPQELAAAPITGADNKINLAVAIKSVNEILLNDETPSYTENLFPGLKIVNKLDPEFSINLNIDIPFVKIYEVAKKELLGKSFESGKKKATIKDFNVYGSGDAFVIEVLLDGSLKGKIYLKGKPVYNDQAKAVEIKELEFDIDTKNKLLKSADWLMHGGFVKLVEPRLKYPVTEKLDEAKKIATANLKENHSINGIVLRGEMDDIGIDKIYITPGAIKAILLFKGKLAVSVDGLSKM